MGVCVELLQGCTPETTHASVDGAIPMHIQAVLSTPSGFQRVREIWRGK